MNSNFNTNLPHFCNESKLETVLLIDEQETELNDDPGKKRTDVNRSNYETTLKTLSQTTTLSQKTNGHHLHGDAECPSKDGKAVVDSREEHIMDIFEASKSGILVAVQLFIENEGRSILNSYDPNGVTPIHYACKNGHKFLVQLMVDFQADLELATRGTNDQRPLHWAAAAGHVEILEILTEAGVDLESLDNKGRTPLMVAAQNGKNTAISYLISKGAEYNVVDKEGDGPVHWAASNGHSETIRLLVYLGLNPELRDNYDQKPVHLACVNGNLTCIKELVEIDRVDFREPDKNGKTPLMLAKGRKRFDVVEYLQMADNRNSIRRKLKFSLKSLLFGPPGNNKYAMLFVIIVIISIGYPLYILKAVPYTWYDLEELHIIFIFVNILMWTFFCKAVNVQPGFVPQNDASYKEIMNKMTSKSNNTLDASHQKKSTGELNRLCHTCKCLKPMRSKHCRVCNRCIMQFDHHCPYVYNCVGENNRHWFTLFLIFMSVMCMIGQFFAFIILRYHDNGWILFLSFILFCFCSGISYLVTIGTLYQIYLGVTTNERINWRRYPYLQDGQGRYYNPFNEGVVKNFLVHMNIRPQKNVVQFLNNIQVV